MTAFEALKGFDWIMHTFSILQQYSKHCHTEDGVSLQHKMDIRGCLDILDLSTQELQEVRTSRGEQAIAKWTRPHLAATKEDRTSLWWHTNNLPNVLNFWYDLPSQPGHPLGVSAQR